MSVETILFDLDNTLVRCMTYYTFTRKNIFKIFSKETGLPLEYIEATLDTYEAERVKKKDGYSKDAFLDSVNGVRIKLYEKLLENDREAAERFYNSDVPFKLIQFTSEVYDAPYTIYEDVPDALNLLKMKGYSLYIITKGDFYGQSRKAANLPKVFDGLFVLPHKNQYTWHGALETAQLKIESTIVVGDSIRDDINPALQVGLRAIRMNRENTTWVGDPRVDITSNVPEIKNLTELLTVLETF